MSEQEQEKKQTGIRLSENTIKEIKILALKNSIFFEDYVDTILKEHIISKNN